MPYLNWRDLPNQPEISEHESLTRQISLRLTSAEAHTLAGKLGELSGTSGELRLDLPNEWAVFWKIRDEETRLLLAHPQKDQWVATVAMIQSHADSLIEKLKASGEIYLSQIAAPLGSVSNVEIMISVGS